MSLGRARAGAVAAIVASLGASLLVNACESIAAIEDFTYVARDSGRDGGPADDGGGEQDGGGGQDGGVTVDDDGCPQGRGPRMVRVGPLCVDATEVTEAQYQEMLAGATPSQPPRCAWNESLVPGEATGLSPICFPAGPTFPVGCVDYCDALTFCAWAGKSLCGAPGGGETPFDAGADRAASSWYRACAFGPDDDGGGPRAYPYGSVYSATACNGRDRDAGRMAPAGATRTCEGATPGLFDMSGNMWEWEDSCDREDAGADPSLQPCRIRGGSVTDGQEQLRCVSAEAQARRFQQYNVGFRCCAEPR